MLSIILASSILFSYVSADLEIAPYEVTKSHEGWEERSYPAVKWISAEGFDIRPHDGESHDRIFFQLFDYIDGQNDQGVKIPMTAPVTLRILPGEGPNCEGNFTMSFFIPMAFQENTPVPNNPDIYIEERPAMNVAALRFPGFPGDIDFSIKAAELYELATAEGVNVADVPLWTAGYSGPNVIINRRNEVWLEV
eukprot:TRINITY_DN13314_c0_g1_i2.p1 TRINITY_DN13314_c0_g1~~TRINITY_DN13314_c0_g1_i2.p1  ORF type:complete len:201 (-),score=36.77 TRINITY_DN13314_c0_g1_i2:115-696(-)